MVAESPHTARARNGSSPSSPAIAPLTNRSAPPPTDPPSDPATGPIAEPAAVQLADSPAAPLAEPGAAALHEPGAAPMIEPGAAPIIEIVRRLQEGALVPADLDPALRRQCVMHLTVLGFSTSEIAELLTIADRTVRRDRAAIRREEALEPSPTLGDELLGEFQRLALASVQRLTRMAADHSTPAYARLWAEDAIARIYQRFLETVRRLGYLQTGALRLRKLSAAARAAATAAAAPGTPLPDLPALPELRDITEFAARLARG